MSALTDVADQSPARCAILGSGNIGTDLMMKLRRSKVLEPTALVGIDPASEGLRIARSVGIESSAEGVDWILSRAADIDLVFEATSASVHRRNAPLLKEAGLRCIDLTPAKVGPGVVPVVNLGVVGWERNLNLVTCGGQATVPIVAAVTAVCDVEYAEIVSSVASASAGPGTRQNIDEFTEVTGGALVEIGGAHTGKAIIILNPAVPPILMRNTVYCAIAPEDDRDQIRQSIEDMVCRVARYVPGYRLRTEPVFDEDRVAVVVEVEGAGDYLPSYAGNLDIMTSAAVRVAEGVTGNEEGDG